MSFVPVNQPLICVGNFPPNVQFIPGPVFNVPPPPKMRFPQLAPLKIPVNPSAIAEQNGPRQESGRTGMKIDSIFYELQTFSFDSCTASEIISQKYRKRPCFKKIELLIGRLREELNIYHNIPSNINSQGVAWAVKDFIFVFSRIINAWIIMRGYIYDDSENLNNLRKNFDPSFMQNFVEWQGSTLKMIKSLQASIESLDAVAQNKPIVVKEAPDESCRNYSEEFLENFQKNLFCPQLLSNSEEIQLRHSRSNTYFRAGVLKPLMANYSSNSASSEPSTPATPSSIGDYDIFDSGAWFSSDSMSDLDITSPHCSKRLYNRKKSQSLPTTPIEKNCNERPQLSSKKSCSKGLVEQFNSFGMADAQTASIKIVEEDESDQEEKFKSLYKDEGMKIFYLVSEIKKVTLADGLKICINMIMEKIKKGKYATLAIILAEFREVIQQVKSMMNNASDGEKVALKGSVIGLESVLSRKAFL